MPWTFYDSTGAEKVISVPRASYVTALPSNPADGDEVIFVDSLTAPTYAWHLRYVAARSSNKWVFIGGSPLSAAVATSETSSSTTYAALATAGPSVTIPVAGDYIVEHGSTLSSGTNATGRHSYDIGGTGAVDADSVATEYVGAVGPTSVFRRKAKSLTAVTLTSKYKTSGGTVTVVERFLAVTPVAIGG